MAIPLLAVCLSSVTQAQTMRIEGRVYSGVEAGCCLLDDIYTGTAYLLYGVGHDLCSVTNWAVAWGYPRNIITFCMQGYPFDVTSFTIGPDCDDGNPCTNDSFNGWGCVNAPIGGTELIVVDLPELVGGYLFNTREANVSLGFRPFEIGCMAIEWSGGIYASTVDCWGDLQGFGGILEASFIGQQLPRAMYSESLATPSSWIPFNRTDVFTGGNFDFLLDGDATVQMFFDQIIQECFIVEPASAVLDSVELIITARRMHDFDGDSYVKLDDAAEFMECMVGPDGGLGFGCSIFDDDGDENVDLTDAAAFQRAFTGP